MTDIAEAEVRLEDKIGEERLTEGQVYTFAAVALSMARALRELDTEYRDVFKLGEDYKPQALADWARLLGEIASGRNE